MGTVLNFSTRNLSKFIEGTIHPRVQILEKFEVISLTCEFTTPLKMDPTRSVLFIKNVTNLR